MLEAAKTGPVTLEVASCARPAPTPRQRPRPSGPSGKHPPHRGGGKSRLSYPEARSLELDGSRRGPFCRARALLQGVKRARCPCPGAGGRRRCRTHIYSGSPNCSSRDAAAAAFIAAVGARILDHDAGQGRNERTRGVSRSVVVGTTLLTTVFDNNNALIVLLPDGGDCTSCTRLVKWTPRVPASPALPALPHTQYTHTQSHNRRHGSRLGAGRRGWDAAEQRSRGRLAAASEARPAGSG